MKIGLIGTGIMGSAIARRLLTKGYKLIAYNKSKEKAEMIKMLDVANTPKHVAEECQFIFVVLKDSKALEDVCFKDDGIVYAKKELILANVSTISPIHTKEIALRLEQYNITMLDAPVMGGPQLAENGELISMVAGDKNAFDKYEHIFKAISKRIFYLGDIGSASLMKLAMNLQIAMLSLALSEGIALVKGFNLDPQTFIEILNSTYFKTGMSERKAPKMIKHDFEKTFALSMMLKDLHEINFTAKEHNIVLPMSGLAEELYRIANNKGYGDLDYTGILALIEEINALNNKSVH